MVKVPDILFDKKVFAALAKQNIKIAAHKRPYDVIITTPNAVYQVELKYEGRPYKPHQVWNINKINSIKPFSAFGLRYYKDKMVVDYISEKHSVESVKELIEFINLKSK